MTYYPLHESSSNFYADAENINDCTVAKLNGNEGEWMMYEPFFWSKGVNDYLNNRHYSCYSSNGPDNMPPIPAATVLTLDDIKGTQGGFLAERKILSGKPTLRILIVVIRLILFVRLMLLDISVYVFQVFPVLTSLVVYL